MSRRRVVITGLGPITGFGLGLEPLWSALLEGRSAIRRISRFDPAGFPCQVAVELSDESFDVRQVVPKSYRKATKVMARDIELAVGAAASAIADAKLVTKASDANGGGGITIPGDRFGCHIGAGLIAAEIDELTSALVTSRAPDGSFDLKQWGEKGMQNLTPLWLLKYLPNMLACHVTIIHDCRGPSNTITCAEASGMLSVGESMRVIERGAADACLSGGAESKINPMGLLRQHFAGRTATVNGSGDPAAVVRPFDPAARGTVLGEGGGILVLEAREIAQARAARIYAELVGFGASQSIGSGASPSRGSPAGAMATARDGGGMALEGDPQGLADAIESALRDAQLGAEQIDAIVPLGTGIPRVDAAEAAAIGQVFGQRAAAIPLVTIVPNVGNCGAGCSAIALSVAARVLLEQVLPARLNSASVPGLDAAARPTQSAAQSSRGLRHILAMTTSLGGQNAAVILRRA